MSSQDFADESSENGSYHHESVENGGSDPNDTYPHCSPLALEQIRMAFTGMVCIEECPPRMIECPIFKDFVSTLNPFVKTGDFQSLKDDCLKYYEAEMIQIKHVLTNMDGKINLSVEMLKRYAFYDYLCLRAHFVDDTWKLKKWVLRFQILHWESIPEAILKILEYWGIRDKVLAITLRSNILYDETVEMLKSYIEKKSEVQVKSKLFHVYCCAEFLTSMAQDALEEIPIIIDKSRGLIALEFVDPSYLLSAEEWKRLKGISKLVDKLHGVAEILFHAKYPTASTFLNNLYDLGVSLKRDFSNSCSYINAIVEKLQQKFGKYWEDMFLVMAIAAVMDPRSSFLQQEISECDSCPSDCEIGGSNSEKEEEDLPNKKRKVGVASCEGEATNMTSHLEEYRQFVQASSRPPRPELDWYLEEPVPAWDQDFNMLKLWKSERPKYPTLSKMAHDLLSIPFSVVSSYDAYYTEEKLVDKRLLSSSVALMNALMCTRSWHQRR
ncbi:hypothetical protein ACH5RR_033597 [Cinchona calisaya]|uniref:Transposase n=1 Tax=Cinchona calisaya TaxID=153742 RepID=A0ABD2YPZ7_9GENT